MKTEDIVIGELGELLSYSSLHAELGISSHDVVALTLICKTQDRSEGLYSNVLNGVAERYPGNIIYTCKPGTIGLKSSLDLTKIDIVVRFMTVHNSVHYYSSVLLIFDDFTDKDTKILEALYPTLATFGNRGKVYVFRDNQLVDLCCGPT